MERALNYVKKLFRGYVGVAINVDYSTGRIFISMKDGSKITSDVRNQIVNTNLYTIE